MKSLQGAESWDPGALGGDSVAIPSGKPFRVDGDSEWKAIPSGWLFRVDGCSEWMAVPIGNRTKVGSLPQTASRRKHRLSGRPDCAQIDFQGVGVENPSFGRTLGTNTNPCLVKLRCAQIGSNILI